MFSHASRIVAVLALILGVFHFVLGVSIAAGWIGPESEALARYAAAPTTGEVMTEAPTSSFSLSRWAPWPRSASPFADREANSVLVMLDRTGPQLVFDFRPSRKV